MSSPFRTMHHLCIVVHDIDKAVEYYSRLGVGPWRDFANPAVLTRLTVPNREALFAMKYRSAQLGGIELQLCQPPELDCPQRRFLDTHGEGVFQLGFLAGDIDRSERAGTELGLKVLMSGRRADGTGFTYFDTHDDAGTTLMVRSSPPGGTTPSADRSEGSSPS
ncbi:VOC family protein [Streptomyces sp. NPDC058457]|uniref:VOC family protein n=1 Tax=Streptomyces sp. NPDC058457 TaxID=3346507 RepID=UPI0036562A48